MKSEVYEAILSPSEIEIVSEKTRNFLANVHVEKRDITRYALAVEEILLKNIDVGKTGSVIRLTVGEKLLSPFVMVEIEGSAENVYVEKEKSFFENQLLKSIGVSPEYQYTGDTNVYTFKIKRKKRNPLFSLIIAIVSAVIIGGIGLILPENVRAVAQEDFFTPLHDTFFNVLGCVAGPMVFLSVAWGIYGIGDAATLKQVGKKMIFGYIAIVYVAVFAALLILLPVMNLDFSDTAQGGNAVSELLGIVLGIVPKNIFSPFVDGNTLQIIFLAIVIGIALLFLGKKTQAVARAVEQINYIVQFLIDFISKLVPCFIFIMFVKIIWSDALSIFLSAGKVFVLSTITIIVVMIISVARCAIENHVKFLPLARKGLGTYLIALTTASSAAAFGMNVNTCKNKLGIKETATSFGIPLGMVVLKPNTAVCYVAITLFFAESYSVPISWTWILVLFLIAGILAIATPPIPGGGIATYTVMFSMLGVPLEALAIALACDTVFDFLSTGGDQYSLQYVLLHQASKLGLADKSVLKK